MSSGFRDSTFTLAGMSGGETRSVTCHHTRIHPLWGPSCYSTSRPGRALAGAISMSSAALRTRPWKGRRLWTLCHAATCRHASLVQLQCRLSLGDRIASACEVFRFSLWPLITREDYKKGISTLCANVCCKCLHHRLLVLAQHVAEQ